MKSNLLCFAVNAGLWLACYGQAAGEQLEGRKISCNTSAYGCCTGTETPAHGPNQEGCCLLEVYGCCPDNINPAVGPLLEGCGCEHSHFGCCPDGETTASGPNGEGCGCQYTQHGCCPDKHTVASGPEFEGCGCHTYQFGCCPDGVTRAQGERQSGCSCDRSAYGCCDDMTTAASGPDKAGCDCSNSKYGCCADGQTAASGSYFRGCTDIPENKQVPVTTRIATDVPPVVATGTDLSITCDVNGYPDPEVYWSKNDVRIENTDRIRISEYRLTISSVTTEDSGDYTCHAANQQASHSSSVRVQVQGLLNPAECTDSPNFANCPLIVNAKYCGHQYFSKFCCKSCVEAGQIHPSISE